MAPATLAGFKGFYPVLKQNADSGSDAAIQTAMEEVGERGHSWGSSEDAYIYFLNLDFQIRFLKSGENLASHAASMSPEQGEDLLPKGASGR